MYRTQLSTLICAAFFCAPMVSAHEFWIEPLEFQVESDKSVQAHLRNGELFEGTAQPFSERSTTRIEMIMGKEANPVIGRLGDRPAIQLPATKRDGLMILIHEAAPSVLTYREWPKFQKFVAHKDFTDALSQHEARKWPKEGFKESYTRHSKALVAIGSGAGADRPLGLETEFVALDNPYLPEFDGTFDVELLLQGMPRADAQIEVYARDPQGLVTVTLTRTDAQGRAAIPVTAGMDYLLDAVVLRPFEGASPAANGPIWETLWASMTFGVPVR